LPINRLACLHLGITAGEALIIRSLVQSPLQTR
jgi:hypothetical protein